MRKLIIPALLASAAFAVQPAQAAVTLNGFTLDTGSFGGQLGVHSAGTQSGSSLSGFINQEGSGVTFSTATGNLSITGSGEATVVGDPLIEDLNVVFAHGWDNITFSFADGKGSYNLLVNGTSLFSAAGNCSALCLIGKGQNKFTLAGTGITSLAFTFNPGIGTAKQFRVEGASKAVPEPATWAMMLVGLGAIGATMRRRKHKVGFGYSMA